MTDLSLPLELETAAEEKRKATVESISRLTKYSAYKLAMLIITVIIGIYLTILIANMGGFVDKIRRGRSARMSVWPRRGTPRCARCRMKSAPS
jgi:peptide/nickel transport system permease protein